MCQHQQPHQSMCISMCMWALFFFLWERASSTSEVKQRSFSWTQFLYRSSFSLVCNCSCRIWSHPVKHSLLAFLFFSVLISIALTQEEQLFFLTPPHPPKNFVLHQSSGSQTVGWAPLVDFLIRCMPEKVWELIKHKFYTCLNCGPAGPICMVLMQLLWKIFQGENIEWLFLFG